MCPRWNLGNTDVTETLRTDRQLGRALPPPPLPPPTQHLPQAVTSHPLTSARLGKGDGRASRKQKNQLWTRHARPLKTQILRVDRKKPNGRDTPSRPPVKAAVKRRILLERTSCLSYPKHNSHLLTSHRRFRPGETHNNLPRIWRRATGWKGPLELAASTTILPPALLHVNI